MKHTKRIASLLLALVMVFGLATTAFAYDVTIQNTTSGHTYEAYQIFTGDLHNDDDPDAVAGTNAVLSNIQWGSSVTNVVELTEAGHTAESVAEKLANGEMTTDALLMLVSLANPVKTDNYDDNKYEITGLVAGYYLIKDQYGSLNGTGEAYTEYIIEVVEDSTMMPKSDVPSVEKKVDDKNDSDNSEDAVEWEDSADYDIGDDVPFQLKATLASNVSAYHSYKIVFHDTLSEGLTYNNDAKVMFGTTDVTEHFTITYSAETNKLTISCDDVKEFGATDSSVITVTYTAELNENAVIGAVGNPNEVHLEFSNNPNWTPTPGEDETPSEPTEPGQTEPSEPTEPEEPPTGETPKDEVIVFTYETIVNKVDEDGEELKGAGFTLYKYDANVEGEDKWVAVGSEVKGNDMTTFTWIGLDDGQYKLVETTTPAGYNTIDPIYFTIEATHSEEAAEPKLLTLVVKDANGNDISGEDGIFNVTMQSGEIKTDVVNKAGATLPETGGMGTTLFYIIGGLLVAAAVVLLVTKKRMRTAE